jgi:hypothetical protein
MLRAASLLRGREGGQVRNRQLGIDLSYAFLDPRVRLA